MIVGNRNGSTGAEVSKVGLEASKISLSVKTSQFMDEMSEHEGEQDLDLGGKRGIKLWQLLGGIGGGLGEFEGVDVLWD